MTTLSSSPQPSPENILHTRYLAASISKAIARGDSIAHGCVGFLVGGRCESTEFAGVVGKLVHHCQQGDSFDGALARYPEVFPLTFIRGVRVAITAKDPSPTLEKFLASYCVE